jgi:hypothetical protein
VGNLTMIYGAIAFGVATFFLGIGAGALIERWRMLRHPVVTWAWREVQDTDYED